MSAHVGLFDGAPGVRSMTRLGLFICYILEALMILGTVFVAVWGVTHKDSPAPTILNTLTLANSPLLGGIVLILREKRKNDEGTTDPPPPAAPQVVG